MTYIVKYINSISAPDKIFLRNISFLLIRIADKSHPFFEVIRNLHPDTEYITQLIEDINIARTNENELEKLEKIHMRSSNVFTGYHIPKPINKTARDVMINTPHT